MNKIGDIIFKPTVCQIYESINIFEKLDPYIKIFFKDKDEDQTEVQKAGGQNLIFEESLSLPIYKNDNFLFIELWDKDIATRDDLIGQHCLNLQYLPSNGIMQDNITLFDKKNKKEKAKLQYSIEYYPDVQDSSKDLALQDDFFEINQDRKKTEQNPLMINITNEHGQNFHVVNNKDVEMTEVVRNTANFEQEFGVESYINLQQMQYEHQNTIRKMTVERYNNLEDSSKKNFQSLRYNKSNPLSFSIPSQKSLRNNSYEKYYNNYEDREKIVKRNLHNELSKTYFEQLIFTINNGKLKQYIRINLKYKKKNYQKQIIYCKYEYRYKRQLQTLQMFCLRVQNIKKDKEQFAFKQCLIKTINYLKKLRKNN